MIAAIILALGIGTAGERIDCIEVNHYHTDSGKLRFVQVIYWRWSPDYRRLQPHGWRMLKDLRDYPIERGGVWYHGGKRATMYRETWTTYDRERRRRGLSGPWNW